MVYFLSDSHIGSRALTDRHAHEQLICSLLSDLGRDATAIYLLGDIFDFWFEYLWQQPQEYTLTLSTLRQLTDNGVDVHFFTGNHDLWTFGELARQTGMTIHRQHEELVINNRRCFLAHGDGLMSTDTLRKYPKHVRRRIRQFMFIRRIFHCRPLQMLFRLLPPAWGNRFGYEWSRKSRLKELARPWPYKGEDKEELVLFAKEKETTTHFDYYIFGHRHIELDLQLATSARVIILGDLFKLYSYAAMDDNGNIELRTLDIQNN